ncbi:MAG: NAD(P)H-binding protein [Bacteroidales bacterium]
MTIVVFGATGGIGHFVVEYCLKKEYKVRAYVRNQKKIRISHSNLTIIEGSLDDYSRIKETIHGSDAIISCIGIPMKYNYPNFESLKGHLNILRAMKEEKVRRLIDWATPSVRFSRDRKSLITVLPGFIAKIFLPKTKKELIEIANNIVTSDLDWTIVRFIAPKDTDTGKVAVSFGETNLSFSISRRQIAQFMVEELEKNEYIHSMPIIGTIK